MHAGRRIWPDGCLLGIDHLCSVPPTTPQGAQDRNHSLANQRSELAQERNF
jgi:hypothetical protein